MFSVTTNRTFLNQLGEKTKFGVSQKSGRGGLDSLAAWWLDAIIPVSGSSSLSAQSTAGRHQQVTLLDESVHTKPHSTSEPETFQNCCGHCLYLLV